MSLNENSLVNDFISEVKKYLQRLQVYKKQGGKDE